MHDKMRSWQLTEAVDLLVLESEAVAASKRSLIQRPGSWKCFRFYLANFRPTWTDCTCEGYYAENFGMSLWSKPKDGDDVDDFCALKNCPVVSHVLCHEMLRRSGYKRHEQDVHEVWMRHYHGGFALRTYDVNHVETKEKPLFTTIDVQAVTALSR